MECVAPDEITEEQLLAYSYNEADDASVAHIQRCAYCAERSRALAADQLVLRALFHRVECPDAQVLGEFHLGLLSPTEQAAIQDHLNTCPRCVAEVRELDHFLQEASQVANLPAPQHQIKRLVARLAPPSPDLEAQQPALALRGAAAAPADVYQAGDIKVMVGLEVDGLRAGRKMLLGFTAREGRPLESLSGAQVHLSQHGETVAMEQVDTLGNFLFSDLKSGEYELVLVTDQEQVVIETIVV
jgi:hypothetical protein